jgi:hypothetical protein
VGRLASTAPLREMFVVARLLKLNVAAVAVLSAATAHAGHAPFPPIPIRLVDLQGRPIAGAIGGTGFVRDADRDPSYKPDEGAESITSDQRGEASLTLGERMDIYAIRPDKDRPLVGIHEVARDSYLTS